jgi:class 3 adenylate cyclase/DNA-directed RNA polymerase subunit RPC12/RpoP
MIPSVSAVNEQILAERLEQLAAAIPGSGELLDAFDAFVRTAGDDELVRINPVRFGQQCGFPTTAVVELFLHARKRELLTMEWQYVCPGCGEIVERLTSLTSATAHYFCQVCSADRDADLSDFIEVTFNVSPEVRRSRYHDPWSLTPEEHFFRYRFTQSGVVDDGSSLRDHLRDRAVACAYVEPGAAENFKVTAEPGYLWLTNGPALIVGDTRTSERRSFAFEYTGTHSKGFRAEVDAGPVEIEFTNATDERYALMITSLPDHYEVTMQPFLSGAELLSNQTFLDLFVNETIVAGEGLAVRRLALLFTDLQGSTALYDRIGDMKAFDLVRVHFGHLRECIARNSGALVKTIGDAVMASFVDPLDALRAALDMRVQIARFNADAGSDLIGLKIGLHAGACLAVTLNDRLDYFGQTVNIAARIQALSGADEIVVTDYVLSLPGAAELVADLDVERSEVQLKGIAGDVAVHRLRGAAVDASSTRGNGEVARQN